MSGKASKVDVGLSSEDIDKVKAWLTEKWPEDRHECEICGQNHWGVEGHVVAPITLQGYKIQLGGTIYPYVPITCSNCGNTKFLNAALMGLSSKKETKEGIKKNVK